MSRVGWVGTALLILPALLLLLAVFVAPLLRLVQLSLSSSSGPLAPYRELLTDDVYGRVFINTGCSRS